MSSQVSATGQGHGDRDLFPIRGWLPRYRQEMLRGDLFAGAVVAGLAVPQALGYSAIAGVPVQVGLYAVPIALIAYAIFGTSQQLVVGPVSILSVLSGSLVASYNPATVDEAIAYTTAIAIGAGAVLIVVGLLRLGWVAEFLSRPIVTGFVLGLTVLVILGEIPNLLGIENPDGEVLERIGALLRNLGEADLRTALISAFCLAVLFGLGRLLPAVPWSLLVLIGMTAASAALGWSNDGVVVVGEVPSGFPVPGIPDVPLSSLGSLAFSGAAIALLGLAEGLSAARLFAAKHGQRINANQELIAAGAANAASGVFGGLSVAGSLSKTAALDRSNGKSQVAGLVTAVLALAVILVFAPALETLPKAALSAIVVHAVWGVMDFDAMRRYRRVRRLDFNAALAAAIGVLALGPLLGLGTAVALSVFGLVYRSSRVDVEVLGLISGERNTWGSLRDHEDRLTVDGVMVLRVDVPIFWVNGTAIHDAVLELASQDDDLQAIVVDIGGTSQLDTTSVDMLEVLVEELRSRGLEVYLARVMWPARRLMRRSGFMKVLGRDHVVHGVTEAVLRACRQHDIMPPPQLNLAKAAVEPPDDDPEDDPEDDQDVEGSEGALGR